MRKTIVVAFSFLGFCLFVGLIVVAVTLYQIRVEEPQLEDHMGLAHAKYQWYSRNATVTYMGFGLIGTSLLPCLCRALKFKVRI